MAGEIVSAQTAHETVEPKVQDDMGTTLREFGRSVVALRSMMDQDRSFSDMELLFVENHFQVIQMAYLRWKRKHRPLSVGASSQLDSKSRSTDHAESPS